MNDKRIFTGKYVQEELGIDDKKLSKLADYFSDRIDGFAEYVGKWRKYTKREIEFIRYFLRERERFDVDSVVTKDAYDMYYECK
ncbi:hypothetical protein FJQ98_21065 [Lysinibacillus agricola]|uniref:Uncharacterized protein n=1 Tax=Lysinibacillus agricola TaxID=2590012 RepID=A0ABX7APZ5_9BACI|nr:MULTISPECIES: hypothetical protein [Lysinibacillus]KOS64484.1 hypothetical protein AN161_02015 [Lysinibacillus sp. FJAT-14222]QQP11651.1 hypothetical protein FJQ98_21065 [Lysinibacillus agricola]